VSDPEPHEIGLASALRKLGAGKGELGINDLVLRPYTYQGTARKLLERMRLDSGLALSPQNATRTFSLTLRSEPDRLRYLASKLAGGDQYRESVAVALEAMAIEAEQENA
jgi:hypothetical protein